MTERPILYNAWSIQRILAEAKTQTRRVVKPQPSPMEFDPGVRRLVLDGPGLYWELRGTSGKWHRAPDPFAKCPHGIPGDHLWARETWATPGNFDHMRSRDLAASHFSSDMLVYRATEQYGDAYYRWRPSIFMPRWASRILLENREVRVERVQGISTRDCVAEGISRMSNPTPEYPQGTVIRQVSLRRIFGGVWDSINAKPKHARRNPYTGEPEDCYVGYPWEDVRAERKLPSGRVEYIVGNPFVWAVTFSLLEVRR